MEWTKSETLKFIQLLQEYPCLWNRKINDYKNRTKRFKALTQLAAQLNIDSTAIEKKILSLKTQYNRELQKIKARAESDPNDEPYCTWYAFEYLHFIKDDSANENIPRPSSDSLLITIKENDHQEIEAYEESIQDYSSYSNSEQPIQVTQPMSLKRKSDIKTEAIDPLNDSNDSVITNQTKDDFTVFGETISCELRGIKSRKHLLNLKKDIMNLVYDTKLKILEEQHSDDHRS